MPTTKIASTIALLLAVLVSCEDSFAASRKVRPSSTAVRNILESFQINENRIIRTEDSRRMGAKFLNESETGSNRECLIWCWETTDCNVAVYEEKNKGSCYLFDCGPPSAFLCLFTAHAFYTSSLLLSGPVETNYGRWGLPSRHEDELSQLRRPRPTHISRQSPAIPTTAAPTAPVTSPELHCQRFQFQCQNSSECIAVYNVCDGIPQCPDGSDEGDDLNCPGANIEDKTTTTTTPLPQMKTQQTEAVTTSASLPSGARDETVVPPAHEDVKSRGKSSAADGQTFDRRPGLENWSVVDPVLRRPDYGDIYGGYRDKYDDYGVYGDGGRVWDDGGQLYPVAPEAIPPPRQRFRPVLPPRYAQQLRHQQILQQQYRHQLQQKQLAAMQSYGRGDDWKEWRHRPAAVGDRPEPPYVPPPVPYEARRPSPEAPSPTPPHVSVTEAKLVVPPTEDDGENLYEPVVEVAPRPDRSKDPRLAGHPSKTDARPTSARYGRLSEVANMRVSFTQVERSGRDANRESGSAVLALVLGLCVTGLLLVLVGCRLRLARHRLARRGGRSALAHDADYLVNGMYL